VCNIAVWACKRSAELQSSLKMELFSKSVHTVSEFPDMLKL